MPAASTRGWTPGSRPRDGNRPAPPVNVVVVSLPHFGQVTVTCSPGAGGSNDVHPPQAGHLSGIARTGPRCGGPMIVISRPHPVQVTVTDSSTSGGSNGVQASQSEHLILAGTGGPTKLAR